MTATTQWNINDKLEEYHLGKCYHFEKLETSPEYLRAHDYTIGSLATSIDLKGAFVSEPEYSDCWDVSPIIPDELVHAVTFDDEGTLVIETNDKSLAHSYSESLGKSETTTYQIDKETGWRKNVETHTEYHGSPGVYKFTLEAMDSNTNEKLLETEVLIRFHDAGNTTPALVNFGDGTL